MDNKSKKGRKSTYYSVWQRAGTGRAKELSQIGSTAVAVADGPSASRTALNTQPVALHTHSYTYVFNRLSHHTHRTQLQRAYCEGLYGAPPAEPNAAFYTELDEQLHLQHRTLAALRDKLVVDTLAASGHEEVVDTVAMRQAVNSSLSRQMEFFTSCMEQYCGPGGGCGCNCGGCADCWRRRPPKL